MQPRYEFGQQVRVIRNVRDDGTYPGKDRGDLLVRRGSVGYVRDVGTFLQDQLIYRVHFLDENRQVGCREEELIDSEEPWIESRFEFLQQVAAACDLAANGEVIVARGESGQVLKVLREAAGGVQYQVRFPGRTLQMRELALEEVAQ